MQNSIIKKQPKKEHCRLCSCLLSWKKGTYAQPTISGRSYGTRHHYVAERFFGRTTNKRKYKANPIFEDADFPEYKRQADIFCYECHEELLHNPIFLHEDMDKFAKLVKKRGFDESGHKKTEERKRIGQRIVLLKEVISKGLDELLK